LDLQAPGLSAAERALLSHLLEKQMSSEAAKPASKGNGTDEPSGGHDGDDGGEDEVADSDGTMLVVLCLSWIELWYDPCFSST